MTWHAEQGKHLALQFGDVGVKDLHGVTLGEQRMALREAEQPQDLLCGWVFALTLLGVEREFFDFLALHRPA